MKHSLKLRINRFLRGGGYSVFIALIIATSFKSAIADWYVIPTGSMNPTIVEGDRVFVNKLAYDLKVPYTTWHISEWDAPTRGEIVVFNSPVYGKRLIKRVVGIPEDTVEMQNNQLILNGNKIQYEPVDAFDDAAISFGGNTKQYRLSENLSGTKHPVIMMPKRPAVRSFGPVTVPEGKYLMMGDNRDNSADSRYFGFVDRDLILGHATYIVASLDINNSYRPRWNRFFTKLL